MSRCSQPPPLRRRGVRAALALSLLLTAGSAAAFRCNGWLIDTGISQFEVGQRCGEPQSTEHRTEWRPQTTFQQQCQTLIEPVPSPAIPGHGPSARGPATTYLPRTFCTAFPVTITVPVEVDVWFYDDASVPKALHFENGRLFWIEPLWGLRHG